MVHLSKMGRGGKITYQQPKKALNIEAAELVGLHAGDGYISCGVWGIRCNLRDEKMAQHIVLLARNVLGVEPCVRIRQNTYEIRSGQQPAVKFFYNYGFAEGKNAHTVHIPKQILETENLEIARAFLKGLFSADGSFSVRKSDCSSRMDLSVRSRFLRDEFVELCTRIGFHFNICNPVRVKKGFTMKSTGAFFNVNLTSKNRVLAWMKVIGTYCDTHLEKFKTWQMMGNRI